MEIEKLYCDRCRREVKYLTPVQSKPIGLNRELCTECIDSLKAWLWNRPDPHTTTLVQAKQESQDAPRTILGVAV